MEKKYNLYNWEKLPEMPDNFTINIREVVGESTISEFFAEKKAIKAMRFRGIHYAIREDYMVIGIEMADITPELEEEFNTRYIIERDSTTS